MGSLGGISKHLNEEGDTFTYGELPVKTKHGSLTSTVEEHDVGLEELAI